MKILQIVTLSSLGGAQAVVANLANKLSEENEVIVVAGEGDGKIWNLLKDKVIKIHLKELKRTLSPISDLLTLMSFFRIYKKFKPDIIHLHSSKAGILGRVVLPRKKIIYTVHGFDSIRLAYRKYLQIEKLFQYRCKAIVSVSEYDKRNLLKEGINNNVVCVYNGIEKPQRKQIELKCLNEYNKNILCIARLSPPKNHILFFKIASLLPKYAFFWVGNKNAYINEKPTNVFFLGSQFNAGAYNEFADLFVLPSDYEGLPIVIIEAMSFGKPVVASDVGGISEIVVDDENGYTVENIPELFANKIKYILENEDVYKAFSKNSLEKYNKELTVEKMIDAYLEIYKS